MNTAVGGVGSNIFTENIVLPRETNKGIQVDPADPGFGWKDLTCDIVVRGSAAPVLTLYIGGIYQYSFGVLNPALEVFSNYHIPHDYLPGSILYMHTHWSTIVASTGDINWIYELTYADGYNRAAFPAPVTIPVLQTTHGSAFQHQIAEVQISAPGGVIASAINVSITSGAATLTSASALFNAADIGRTIRITGAGAGGADLDTTITAFASTTSVTVGANAGTTVTTQPNFKYRVLDSDAIEVDGLLLTRVWRQANRTADTINQAPYMHFNDLHYQTSNVATKTKNYPFY